MSLLLKLGSVVIRKELLMEVRYPNNTWDRVRGILFASVLRPWTLPLLICVALFCIQFDITLWKTDRLAFAIREVEYVVAFFLFGLAFFVLVTWLRGGPNYFSVRMSQAGIYRVLDLDIFTPWPFIKEVQVHNGDLYILARKGDDFYIPRSAFVDSAELEAWRSTAASAIQGDLGGLPELSESPNKLIEHAEKKLKLEKLRVVFQVPWLITGSLYHIARSAHLPATDLLMVVHGVALTMCMVGVIIFLYLSKKLKQEAAALW
jgi:hypothetical protein